MKLILSLILILSVAFNSANSFQLTNQKGLKSASGSSSSQPSQVCFKDGYTDSNGYTADYSIVSFNGVGPSKGNPNTAVDFAETGYINLDFVNNQMFIYYALQSMGGLSQGRIWAFGGNNTQYVVPTINGVEYCFTGQLTFDIPAPVKVAYEGDYTIGTFPCEAFAILNSQPTNVTFDYFLVSKNDCSLVTSVAYNALDTVGQVSTNFYGFNGVSNPSDFILPSVCNSPQPIPTSARLLKQMNINLPASLKTRLF